MKYLKKSKAVILTLKVLGAFTSHGECMNLVQNGGLQEIKIISKWPKQNIFQKETMLPPKKSTYQIDYRSVGRTGSKNYKPQDFYASKVDICHWHKE